MQEEKKKKKKRILAGAGVLLLAGACFAAGIRYGGGESESQADYATSSFASDGMDGEVYAKSSNYDMVMEEEAAYDDGVEDTATGEYGIQEAAPESGAKIHYECNATIQTKDFEKTMQGIEEVVDKCGGMIVNSSQSDSNTRWYLDGVETGNGQKTASFEIRIPSDRFGEVSGMLERLEGKVISKNVSSVDRTRNYNNNRDRLEALEAEKKQMLQLMEQAADADSLVVLYSHLTDINSEIAYLTTDQNEIQYDTDYSTLYLYVEAVGQYQEKVEVNASFSEKIASSFRQGWQEFKTGVQDIILWCVRHYIYLLAVVVILAFAIAIRGKSERRKRKEEKKEEKPEEQQEEKSITHARDESRTGLGKGPIL